MCGKYRMYGLVVGLVATLSACGGSGGGEADPTVPRISSDLEISTTQNPHPTPVPGTLGTAPPAPTTGAPPPTPVPGTLGTSPANTWPPPV